MSPSEIGEAIHAFLSEVCPACARAKIALSDPFCPDCMERLPAELLEGVTDRGTYLACFGPAMEHLRRSKDRGK
jgi:hypothetical protein